MTKEEIANKPASEKTLREDFIGQALAGLAVGETNKSLLAAYAIACADAVIERLAAEGEGK